MTQAAIISLHEEYVQAAFDAVLAAESNLAEVDGRLSKALAMLRTEKTIAESALEKAWKALEALMVETGEQEILLPAEGNTVNKVYYTTPRESVKIENPDAVPDDFCKIERKPFLSKISEYLKAGNRPNWAQVQLGESRLAWKSIKRSKVNE